MEEEMKKYGYTQQNLYTKEKRQKKIIKRHLFQSIPGNEEIWEEAEEGMTAYITRDLATKLPDEIYMISTFDDSLVFESEPDLEEKKNAIFGTKGPGKEKYGLPHLLFEQELTQTE